MDGMPYGRHKNGIMAFKKGNKLGNKFSSENQPKRRSRNPLGDFIRGLGKTSASEDDIMSVVPMLMQLSESQVVKYADDPDIPSGFSNVARMWLDPKRRLKLLEWYMNRKYGTPMQRQQTDVTSGGMPILAQMSDEELKKACEEIDKSLER